MNDKWRVGENDNDDVKILSRVVLNFFIEQLQSNR